jgi:hypothetical protein
MRASQLFPVDFAGFLEKVMQVAFDIHGEGYRIVSGEAAMSAKRSDYSRLLPGLIPDLREQARHARLSGRIEKVRGDGSGRRGAAARPFAGSAERRGPRGGTGDPRDRVTGVRRGVFPLLALLG